MLKKGKIKQDREVNESAWKSVMLVTLSTCSVGASSKVECLLLLKEKHISKAPVAVTVSPVHLLYEAIVQNAQLTLTSWVNLVIDYFFMSNISKLVIIECDGVFLFLLLSCMYAASWDLYPNMCVPFDTGLMAAFPNTIMPNPNSISTAIYITAKFRAISLFFAFSDNISLSLFFLFISSQGVGRGGSGSYANEILCFPFKDTSIIFC